MRRIKNTSPDFKIKSGLRIKSAFTLVELIVVITILAILGTIAFISLQGYSRDASDSVRITDIKNISKQLELMLVKVGKVYIPENKVDITASGTVILYQGEMGLDTLSKLRVYNGGLDKINNAPYIYSTNKNLTKYELMGFLENGNRVASIINKVNAAANLTNRYPYVKGDNIGIFLDSTTNEPINPTGENSFEVYCDMTTDRGGWTLFARRIKLTDSIELLNETCIKENQKCNGGILKYKNLFIDGTEIMSYSNIYNKILFKIKIKNPNSNFLKSLSGEKKIYIGYNISNDIYTDSIYYNGGYNIQPSGKNLSIYNKIGGNSFLLCSQPGGCGKGIRFDLGWGKLLYKSLM